MKKADVLFQPLINSISEICGDQNDILENYYNELDKSTQSILDSLLETLCIEKGILEQCKADLTPYQNYDTLLETIKQLSTNFDDLPRLCTSKINFIIIISKVISQNSTEIQDENISFELHHFDVDYSFNEIAYLTESIDLNKIVIWFSPASIDSINKLVQYTANIECWYALLQSATTINFETAQQLTFYSKSHHDAGVSNGNASALLKMHMVSSGLVTVPTIIYTKKPSNSSINNFCPSQSYLQFLDIIGILGEYNNRNDILSKYLSIFHIIENFMYKEPIVGLERTLPGSMFSIRDFKRLYKSIDMDEKKALSNLFKKTFNIPFKGHEFKVFAHDEWNSFLQRNTSEITNIYAFLQSLSINDYNSLNQNNFYDFISRVVYYIRCSVVHNKETEVHISSEKYPQGCKLLFEDYLLSFLEEMIFLLICKENDLVWYSSKSISLWKESA
jgi:hypothetical protein